MNAESEGLSLLVRQADNPWFLEPTAANQSLMPAEVPRTTKCGTVKTTSTYDSRTSTGSSRLSAQTRSAILKARIRSEAKIDEIQKRQYAERHAFEARAMKTQRLQQEQEMMINCQREEQARAHQYELFQAQLQAELNETLAEIAAEDANNHDDPAVTNTIGRVESTNAGPTCTNRPIPNVVSRPKYNACDSVVVPVVSDVRPTGIAGNSGAVFNCGYDIANSMVPSINASPMLNNVIPIATATVNQPTNHAFSLGQSIRPSQGSMSFGNRDTNPPSFQYQPRDGLVSSHNFAAAPFMGSSEFVEQERRLYPLSTVSILTLEPEILNGNPANYHSFFDAFDALISFYVPEPKRKLYFLLQYTARPAHALVKGCQYMPGDQGYYRAR